MAETAMPRKKNCPMADRNQSRLKTLLKPLRRQEQQAQQVYLRAAQEAQALGAGIRCCRIALALQGNWVRGALHAGRPADLATHRQCVSDLKDQMARKRAALAQLAEKIEAQRQDLVRCMKQRKAYDQLLHRQEAEAAAAVARVETRELDHVHAAQAAWRTDDERSAVL
jgi:flagellar biosynthesis chaperone FliJ